MATAEQVDYVAQIGETAGVVWKALSDSGPLSLAQVVKKVRQPRDTVMQALGWLAREDKIVMEDEGRSRIVALR